MNFTYDSKKRNSFKVSKRSKLYNLVVFCNSFGSSKMRCLNFTSDELDYINYYENFRNLDSQGLYFFYSLRDKFLLNSNIFTKKLSEFFYSPKACNIDIETLLYCSILLTNFGYDFTIFLEEWNKVYFINGELFFK